MYDLTKQEQKEVDDVSQKIADRMDDMYREQAFATKQRILSEAFIILQSLGELEISNELLLASKRLGDKLKDNPKAE